MRVRARAWVCVCSHSVLLWSPLGQTLLGPHPLCRGARLGGCGLQRRGAGEEGRGQPSQCHGQGLTSLFLSSPIPRRVSHPRGRPTSGTPSSIARGWRTVSAPQVGAAPQVLARASFPHHKQGQSCGGQGTGLGTEGQKQFSGPRWWVCDGTAPDMGTVGWSFSSLGWLVAWRAG